MKRRHRNAVGEDKTDALRLTSGTASLKASVGGKIETLKIPEKRLDKQNAAIAWRKLKPPLNVQKHSSGDGIPVTSCMAINNLPGLRHAVTNESFPRRD